MAKRRSKSTAPPDADSIRLAHARSWAQFATSLIDRVGWPGLLVFFVFFIMQFWASAEQKTRIVETYVLGTGIFHAWPIVFLGVIFAATCIAQQRIFTKKIDVLAKELDRVGNEKSSLQQELTDHRLQRGNRLAGDGQD